jgi:hypothetical protein
VLAEDHLYCEDCDDIISGRLRKTPCGRTIHAEEYSEHIEECDHDVCRDAHFDQQSQEAYDERREEALNIRRASRVIDPFDMAQESLLWPMMDLD